MHERGWFRTSDLSRVKQRGAGASRGFLPGNQPNGNASNDDRDKPDPVRYGHVWTHDWPHGGTGELPGVVVCVANAHAKR